MRKTGRNWSGVFFGLVLFLAGCAGTYITAGHMVSGYISSKHWVQVPAEIRRIEFVKNYDENDGDTTYKLEGAYIYQFDGVEYRSHRISLVFGSDNIGSYWYDLYQRLVAEYHADTVAAFVNPENPAESVLDRTLRVSHLFFGLFFLLLFCGGGLLLIFGSLKKGKSSPSEKYPSSGGMSASNNNRVTEIDGFIDVAGGLHGKVGGGMFGIAISAVLGAVGIFSISDGWMPGYLFLFAGVLLAGFCLFHIGRKIEVRIHKQTRVLYARQTWFGFVMSMQQGEILESRQFNLKAVSRGQLDDGATVEYYVLNFHTNGEIIRLSGWIEGRRDADKLRQSVTERCFYEPVNSRAA